MADASADDLHQRIDAFWQWWRSIATALADDIDDGRATEWVTRISDQVHAIDDRLAWELGPGRASRHHLTVSSEGDMAVRVIAEHWRQAAPAPDGDWEHYTSKQPQPNLEAVTISLGETHLAFSEVLVACADDEHRERLDVGLYHPALAALEEQGQHTLAFILLDNTLGEDDVETWIGAIDVLAEPPEAAISLVELPDAVAAMRAQATGERYALMRGETPEGQIMVIANLAIKHLDHLLHDHALTIAMPIHQPTPEGFPNEEENVALEVLEDELMTALGDDVVLIGRETGFSRRLLCMHVRLSETFHTRLQGWLEAHTEREIDVDLAPDPGWEMLHRWG